MGQICDQGGKIRHLWVGSLGSSSSLCCKSLLRCIHKKFGSGLPCSEHCWGASRRAPRWAGDSSRSLPRLRPYAAGIGSNTLPMTLKGIKQSRKRRPVYIYFLRERKTEELLWYVIFYQIGTKCRQYSVKCFTCLSIHLESFKSWLLGRFCCSERAEMVLMTFDVLNTTEQVLD